MRIHLALGVLWTSGCLAVNPYVIDVAPSIAAFTATPPCLVPGVRTTITWRWSYSTNPDQEPTCVVKDASGNTACSETTSNGCTSSLRLASNETFTVTCKNGAGSGSATAEFYSTAVTTIADSGAGSLRDVAIHCPGETITFDAGLYGETITLQSAISVADNTTIQGPGADLLTVSGGNMTQLLSIWGGSVAISGLTFREGFCENCSGGAIAVGSSTVDLTISGSVFHSNKSNGNGGAIETHGALTVSDCTFVSNTALPEGGGGGGGIHNNHGEITVTNSTFVSNSGSGGAAIMNDTGDATVSNSTFVSNSGPWGAIYNWGVPAAATVTNCTFSGDGNSLANDTNATLTIGNNIIDVISSGTFVSLGYNLIGNSTGATFAPVATDQIGVSPALDTLGDYGGPTQTMMPSLTSPAVAAIPATSCGVSVDQRGQPRPSSLNANGYCDIGAVERQASDSSYP